MKKNFKLFISGPSGSGKTFFIKDLLKNLDTFASEPSKLIIYVYRVWQPKYEEMGVDIFIEDGSNLIEKINNYAKDKSTLIVFDDLINSESTPSIARLFTVDGRHSNMSLIYVTQKMFVNDDKFREISGNSDYFLVFKNPRNAREIRTLASQMTPGKMDLVNYYVKATEKPFSYLLINLTQQCPDQVKFLSHLFNAAHVVRVYYNSSYLSLHDNHKGNRTNFSKMFLTNEISEECNCTCQDEIQDGPSLFENKDFQHFTSSVTNDDDDDDEIHLTSNVTNDDADVNKGTLAVVTKEPSLDIPEKSTDVLEKSFDQEIQNINQAIDREQRVKPLKLIRSLGIKKATPEKIILRSNYEISPKKEINDETQSRRELDDDDMQKKELSLDNESRVKTSQENLKDVNKFGGSYSSEVWNKLNEIEKDKQKEHEPEAIDNSVEAMQDDISEGNILTTNVENRSQDNSDENKSLEFQLYDNLQCSKCEEVFKNKSAIKKHENSCKVTGFACTECGVNFTTRNGLKSHIKSLHEERPKILTDKKKALAEKNRI